MGGQDDRHPLFIQLTDIGPEHLPQLDIDARRRLIQHQDLRAVDQGFAQEQPPPHPARERSGIGLGFVFQADQRENLVGAALRFRHAVKPGLNLQGAPWGEKRIEVQFLRHYANGGAALSRVHILVEAPDIHLTR